MMRHISEALHDALYDLLPDQGPIEWGEIQRCKAQMRQTWCHDINWLDIETFAIGPEWWWQPHKRIPRTAPHGPFTSQDEALENARLAERKAMSTTEDREDGEICPDCSGAIFDGRCRCAEIDAKIDDALEQGESR